MNIEEQILQINFKDTDQVINFYESNHVYFSNYHRLNDPEKISEYIDIKLHYANALTEKHYLEKVLKILNEVSDLLNKLPEGHWNFEGSERHLRFLKGMASARQNKFKESYPIFKRLIAQDPEHYYYKVWYQHSKLGTYNWLFNGFTIIGILLIIGGFIFSLGDYFPIDLGMIGLLILGISYFGRKGLYEYLKRKSNSQKK